MPYFLPSWCDTTWTTNLAPGYAYYRSYNTPVAAASQEALSPLRLARLHLASLQRRPAESGLLRASPAPLRADLVRASGREHRLRPRRPPPRPPVTTDADARAEALELLWKALKVGGYVRPTAVPGYVFVVGPHGESVAFPVKTAVRSAT